MTNVIDWQKLTDEKRNALIHEKVLGLPLEVLCTELEINHNGYTFWCVSCKKEGQDLLHVPHFRAIPTYSTSFDAAWLVVMTMKEIDKGDFHSAITDLTTGTWNDWDDVCIWDITPSILCIAALKAVGVEVTTA